MLLRIGEERRIGGYRPSWELLWHFSGNPSGTQSTPGQSYNFLSFLQAHLAADRHLAHMLHGAGEEVAVAAAEVHDGVPALVPGGVPAGLRHDGLVVDRARQGGEGKLTETCHMVQELWVGWGHEETLKVCLEVTFPEW